VFKHFFISIGILLISFQSIGQDEKDIPLIIKDTVNLNKDVINPLAPAKAAFYSALLPGLGQAYNKKYWKIPLVYAGIGTGLYFYNLNNKEYNSFRSAYKSRLEGFNNDPYVGLYTTETLINAQKVFQRNRNLSLVVTAGFYILNIIDANVDAHLLQFNVNENLTLRPDVMQNEMNQKPQMGLTLSFNF
jgi:hypothetical protein